MLTLLFLYAPVKSNALHDPVSTAPDSAHTCQCKSWCDASLVQHFHHVCCAERLLAMSRTRVLTCVNLSDDSLTSSLDSLMHASIWLPDSCARPVHCLNRRRNMARSWLRCRGLTGVSRHAVMDTHDGPRAISWSMYSYLLGKWACYCMDCSCHLSHAFFEVAKLPSALVFGIVRHHPLANCSASQGCWTTISHS